MWYQNGRMVHQDQFHKMIVSEKGFHSFIFEAVKSSDAGTYECVAVNRAGEASFAVKLEVIGKTESTDSYLATHGKSQSSNAFVPSHFQDIKQLRSRGRSPDIQAQTITNTLPFPRLF